jgi:WXG100 family type VII secretion target
MSDPTYWFDQEAHDDAVQDIRDADNAIRNEVNDCDQVAMKNFESWKSTMSKAQYDEHKSKWDTALNNMQNILAKAEPALRAIKDNYDHTDHKIQRSFA